MSCPLVLWAGSLPWASPGSNPGDGRLRFCNLCRGPLCRTPFPASSCLFQLPEASHTPWLVAPSSSCLTASKGELSPSHAASLLPAAVPSSRSVQNPVIALSPPGFSRIVYSFQGHGIGNLEYIGSPNSPLPCNATCSRH